MACIDSHYGSYGQYESQERLDFYARSLCWAMQKIEGTKVWDSAPKELKRWWKDHKAEDRDRIKSEKKLSKERKEAKLALAKLSKRERELLDIDMEQYGD